MAISSAIIKTYYDILESSILGSNRKESKYVLLSIDRIMTDEEFTVTLFQTHTKQDVSVIHIQLSGYGQNNRGETFTFQKYTISSIFPYDE
jgi:hypothetical protein